MFQGLRTVIYAVTDLEKAEDWHSQVLSQQPYFSEPFYVGFNVGGFELGLDPDTSSVKLATTRSRIGVWRTLRRPMSAFSALEHARTVPLARSGAEFSSAASSTHSGTSLDIIENPHFKLG